MCVSLHTRLHATIPTRTHTLRPYVRHTSLCDCDARHRAAARCATVQSSDVCSKQTADSEM